MVVCLLPQLLIISLCSCSLALQVLFPTPKVSSSTSRTSPSSPRVASIASAVTNSQLYNRRQREKLKDVFRRHASVFDSLLHRDTSEASSKFVFVGGKGGVGKTTSSSAIALKLADEGFKTLLVSTDPAHSLSDSLDVSIQKGTPTMVATETNLWALEIDINQSMEDFKEAASSLDAGALSSALGIPESMINSLGLDDLTSLFTNPPPGIDEIVGLSQIIKYGDRNNEDMKFDRIVIDTAPTGHTIRLLQLPTFVNALAGNLIRFRSKIADAVSTFQNMFSSDPNQSSTSSKVNTALDKLETVQTNMELVQSIMRDPKRTEFTVVTIPTSLAVAESARLVNSLQAEGIDVGAILCNQVVSDESGLQYIENRRKAQQASIMSLQNTIEMNREADEVKMEVTQVPYLDTEILGIYGLKFFANVAHAPKANTATNPIDSRKLSIYGGKGGVGKTTSAAAWGARLSDAGMRTLVVSTDPAHSLGDAFAESLTGFPRLVDSVSSEGGQLWAMEIDPNTALSEFKELLGATAEKMQNNEGGIGGTLGAMGLPDLANELKEMMRSVVDPPPGTDEIVALSKVITYLEEGFKTPSGEIIRFDRIVLDTAPTGHTLRMLTLPDFLREFIRKVKIIRDKTGGFMGGGDTNVNEETVDRLSKFENNMEKLEDMLHNPKETEFVIVTIASEVAMAETKRLIASLKDDSVYLRRIIINQVLPNDDTSEELATKFLNNIRSNQANAMSQLNQLSITSNVPLVKVPFFEMEARSTYGLKYVGNFIFQ